MSKLGCTKPAFLKKFLQKLCVHDYVDRANSKVEARQFYCKITKTLLEAGLELSKWISSDHQF